MSKTKVLNYQIPKKEEGILELKEVLTLGIMKNREYSPEN